MLLNLTCSVFLVVYCHTAKLVPVGYGIKKMTIMMTIVDDLVSLDELIEDHLTAGEGAEYIQSCDIVAFNKICESALKLQCCIHALIIRASELRTELHYLFCVQKSRSSFFGAI